MKLLDQVRLKCQMLHDYEGIRESGNERIGESGNQEICITLHA